VWVCVREGFVMCGCVCVSFLNVYVCVGFVMRVRVCWFCNVCVCVYVWVL
jgi:hypothetical protein